MKIKHLISTVGLALSLAGAALAQSIVGQPWTGEYGITETVAQIQARQALMPPKTEPFMMNEENEYHPRKTMGAGGMNSATYPPGNDPIRKNYGGPYFGTPSGSISGPTLLGNTGSLPPDSNGDVGPSQCIIAVNGWIKSFNKTTMAADGALNADIDVFFNSVRAGIGTSDPQIRFDRLTNKWYVLIINVSFPNRILLAVSSGPTITSSSSFTFFFAAQNTISPAGNATALLDYPSLGIDSQAIYVGGNMFTTTAFEGVSLFVIRKSSVQGAGPIVASAFRNVSNGPYAARGVDNNDPASTDGYFVGVSQTVFSQLVFCRVSTPGGTPVLGARQNIVVPTTVNPQTVVTSGATRALDALDDRCFYAVLKPNPVTGTKTLWTAHNIEVNASGVASTSGNRNGVRWYELDAIAGTGTPTLRQSGTIFDSAATNPKSAWIGTMNVNGQGHALAGFSFAGAASFAGNAFAGRLVSQTLGQMDAIVPMAAGNAAYNRTETNPQRWGDYSMTSVDPDDNMTFWTTQMFCNAGNDYRVDMYKILAPPPATIASITPNTIAQGATINITVTGTVVSGSGFYDPGAGFTKRLAALFSGTGLTVNSVTFTNATSITLNVTAAAGATTGLRNLTVTNPDGQATTANNILTVNASGNPVPVLTSITPVSRVSKTGDFTLTLNGSNFVATSVARFNGNALTTTFVNAGQLTATVPNSMIQTSGTFPITVFNPAPGGGTSNSLNFTVSPTSFTGAITLLDFGPDEAGTLATVALYSGTTLITTANVTLGSGGSFSFTRDIAPGTYDAYLTVSPHWLTKKVGGVVVNTTGSVPPVNASLINGDVDGDNEVGPGDFGALSAAFGSVSGDGNWNPNADLDGDGEVGPSDFGTLSANFGISGDAP